MGEMYCDCNYYTSKPIIITRKVLASKAVPQPKCPARQNMQRLMIGFMKYADIPLNVMVLMTLFNLDWAVKSYGHKFGLPFTYCIVSHQLPACAKDFCMLEKH